MSHAFFAIPGDINAATGGYAYDRTIMAECGKAGFDLRHCPLAGAFPHPEADELKAVRRRLAELPEDRPLLVDGLALGAFDGETVSAINAPLIALVHHPLAFETGITQTRRAELLASERLALARSRAVIATSTTTARLLEEEYGVPSGKITVAEPGVLPAPRASGSSSGRLSLLSVGAISPRKAYGVLVAALALLVDLDWQLTIIGPALDEAEAERVRLLIEHHQLQTRVRLAGRVDAAQLARAYDQADIFVMPSLFEGYGMVITEALARGLPLVSTSGGALRETVPEEAAIKVPPNDAGALMTALRQMISDGCLRRGKADAAWKIAQNLPSWRGSAAKIIDVIKGVC